MAPPGAEHRLLHGVLGLEGRGEHPVAVAGQLPAVLLERALELPRGERGCRFHDAHRTDRPRACAELIAGPVSG
jgi:hypothetical protein